MIKHSTNQKLHHFVKWAGGKRQLLDKIITRMPSNYNSYFEPFVGGGALLFKLQPKQVVINDINTSLISVHKNITNKPQEFISAIKKLDNRIGGVEIV